MKKTITGLTIAIVMIFGSTFSFASTGIIISDVAKPGIIISDSKKADTTTTNTATTCRDGIIVFGRTGIIVFGVTIGEDPCTQDTGNTGIIVFG